MRKPLEPHRSSRPHSRPAPWWPLAILLLGIATPLWAQELPEPGTWRTVANLNQARAGHTATLLANGSVLIAGGRDASGHALSDAEIFDPSTGQYTPISAAVPTPVWGHTATLVADGTVLSAGGPDAPGRPVASAQLFDPSSSPFPSVGSMTTPRGAHTATPLRDARILIAGGSDGQTALASLEIYDPATRTFSLAPSTMIAPRESHTATSLADGRVLIAGGSNASGALNTSELYDPPGGTITAAGPLNLPRTLASAALLLDGTVLVAGGQATGNVDLNSAEVYDPVTNTFALLPALMSTARSGHAGLRLPDNGRVLLVGGTSAGQVVATAEVYDPVTSSFRQVGSPTAPRQLFATNFFAEPDLGIVLMSGGLDTTRSPLASSEAFYYPTLRSDKPDYSPGDIVTLMGEGWRPNETISINLHESSGDPDTNLTATADAHGAFVNSEFLVQPADRGVTFLATATGQTSKWTAQTIFTDDRTILSVSLNGGTPWTPPSPSTNGAPVTVLPGATISATIQVQTTGTGVAARWRSTSWQIGSGGVVCVNHADHNSAGTFTESFNVTAPSLTGSYSISFIAYSDDTCSQNPSTPLTLANAIIVKDNTTTKITSDTPDPSVAGQPYTVTWTVKVEHSGSGTPTGTVSVDDGTGASCSAAVAAGGCSLTSTTAGAKTLTATYSGDSNFNTSTSPCAPHQVNVRPTTTTVSCSPASVPVGSPTTCTATVTDTGPGTAISPTGAVAFSSSGSGAFTPSDSCTLSGSGASASCSVTYTPSAVETGSHTITASYAGDSAHSTSSGTFALTVVKHPTATGLVCDPSVPVSSAANCMATVTDSVATAPFPTGLVNFFADGAATSFASCSLSGSGVTQSCSVSYTPTTAGAHSIGAKYAGDSAHVFSSRIPRPPGSTLFPYATLFRSDPSVPVSSAANCMATVTDSVATAPFPTGLVNFFADGAATSFASCSLSGSGVTQS